tara:strand:+ start:4542 stop:5174 length:633 start_codon:yes stop_codon:yes gene_type:complete
VNKIIYQKKNFDIEIIIVDDASVDGTREILNQKLKNTADIILFNDQNEGKGFTVSKGINAATGQIVLIQDADLEYDPSEYSKLINPIINNKADVVYGSRFLGGDEKRILFFWHYVANKFLTILSNMLTNLNLTDMETGFKVFRKELIKKIELKEKRFGFEPEITAKISKLKPRIYEVGISYFGRTYDEGKKITWRDGFSAIRCIIVYNLF